MSSKRKVRRPRSVVWYYFDKLPDEQFKARCKICGFHCLHGTNTSNLFYHLRQKHPESHAEAEEQKQQEAKLYEELRAKSGASSSQTSGKSAVRGRGRGRPRLSHSSSSKAAESMQAVVKSESSFVPQTFLHGQGPLKKAHLHVNVTRGKGATNAELTTGLVHWLATDLLHPSVLAQKGFSVFLTGCGIHNEIPNSTSLLETHVPKLVEATKVRVKHDLESGMVSAALTVENWLYKEVQNFVTVTAHFISVDWSMASYVLETIDCTEDKSETSMTSNLKRVTDEWGLTSTITVLMSDKPDDALSSASLVNGWEELSCFGRELNIIVATALESSPDFDRVHKKMTEAVNFFCQNLKAAQALAAVQQQHNLPTDKLIKERAGLWTSVYASMGRVLEQYEAVNTVLCFLGRDHMCLCDDEVDIIRDVIEILKPFKAAVDELCAGPYTCVSKLIPLATLLQQVTAAGVNGHEVGGSQAGAELRNSLLEQMQQHFSGLESKPILAIATLLDPRFKKHAFTFTEHLQTAEDQLLSQTQDIVSNNSDGTNDVLTNSETVTIGSGSLWGTFDRKVVDAKALKTDVSEAENETRRYFKEVNIVRTADPLLWWRTNEVQFPHLKVLAKKYLCVPATAVNSSHLFSKAGLDFANSRDMFRPTHINNMLFLNQNLN